MVFESKRSSLVAGAALLIVGGMFLNVHLHRPHHDLSNLKSPEQRTGEAVGEEEKDLRPVSSGKKKDSTTCSPPRIVYVPTTKKKEKQAEANAIPLDDQDAAGEIGNHDRADAAADDVDDVKKKEKGLTKEDSSPKDKKDVRTEIEVDEVLPADQNDEGIEPFSRDETSGVRTFKESCVFPETDRLAFMPKEKIRERVKGWIKKKVDSKQMNEPSEPLKIISLPDTLAPAFSMRDVCALGHYPKDLAHYHTWISGHRIVSGKQPDDDEFAEKLVSMVILGSRCATKDPSKNSGNRRGFPAFRLVLRSWVDAITRKSVLAEKDSSADSLTDLGAPDYSERTDRRFFIFYSDIVALLEGGDKPGSHAPTALCFPTIHEREESWRWFPSTKIADTFRGRLWAPLALDKHQHRMQNDLRKIPFDKQRKLQILVLKREEDRHFNEAVAAKFIEEKFGKVADIVFTQFDKPPAKHLKAENNISVAPYSEQVKAIFETDVLVAAHGAALSNIVYMRPGSVVIELFPHNFRYYMYEELSRVMSLKYVPFEGVVVSPPGCCKSAKLNLKPVGDDAKGAYNKVVVERDEKSVLRTAGELLSGKFLEAEGKLVLKGGKESKSGDKFEIAPESKHRLTSIRELNGLRSCKGCDIYVTNQDWYYLIKNALSSIWLQNSRLSNVHHFDIRR